MLLSRVSRTAARVIKCSESNLQRNLHFNAALTRDIDASLLTDALSLNPDQKAGLNLPLALRQHEELVQALRSAGVVTINLPSDKYADSVFVEDTAVVVNNVVIITNPGAISRRGEVAAVKRHFMNVASGGGGSGKSLSVRHLISGTLDGGDVLFTGKEVFVGHTARTNLLGVDSLRSILAHYDIPVHTVPVLDFARAVNDVDTLHLKSFCSLCCDDTIVVGGQIGEQFKLWLQSVQQSTTRPRVLTVPDQAAANCVLVNDTLIRRCDLEFPASGAVFTALVAEVNRDRKRIATGNMSASNSSNNNTHSISGNGLLREVQLNASELAKVDGALTCCSVLYNTYVGDSKVSGSYRP